ncbi:MAG TPA: hypothetical protein PKX87_06630, partial [Alphaproteobacteria bacterium]|nr:hypothetical protein [Alphaproteobacteria bacterium]
FIVYRGSLKDCKNALFNRGFPKDGQVLPPFRRRIPAKTASCGKKDPVYRTNTSLHPGKKRTKKPD